MGSGSGRGGSEERRALIDRGKVKAKDEESQNGRMGVWVLRNIDVCALLNSNMQPGLQNH